jgi:hypothetical protein
VERELLRQMLEGSSEQNCQGHRNQKRQDAELEIVSGLQELIPVVQVFCQRREGCYKQRDQD